MSKQICKIRPKIVDIRNNKLVFYPFRVKANIYSGSCNNVNGPYANTCVPDTVKNINAKVFNLLSQTNQTKHIEWHENCKCKCRLKYKCRLEASVCNDRQRWKEDTFRIKILFGILVIVIASAINHAVHGNI